MVITSKFLVNTNRRCKLILPGKYKFTNIYVPKIKVFIYKNKDILGILSESDDFSDFTQKKFITDNPLYTTKALKKTSEIINANKDLENKIDVVSSYKDNENILNILKKKYLYDSKDYLMTAIINYVSNEKRRIKLCVVGSDEEDIERTLRTETKNTAFDVNKANIKNLIGVNTNISYSAAKYFQLYSFSRNGGLTDFLPSYSNIKSGDVIKKKDVIEENKYVVQNNVESNIQKTWDEVHKSYDLIRAEMNVNKFINDKKEKNSLWEDLENSSEIK